MTVGRSRPLSILVNNEDKGSGFALATSPSGSTRVALTANHVVGKQKASSFQFVTQASVKVPVDRVEGNEDLDIAVLYLGEDVAEGLAVGKAVKGAAWQVETQPLGNDPKLTGTVTDTHWRFEKRVGGPDIYVLQLEVNEQLGNYKGYSGSAVMLDTPSGGVIGILFEQQLSRLPGTIGQSKPATNVLYAIPIQDVLERFHLTAASAVPVRGSSKTLSSIRFRRIDAASTSNTPPPLFLETHERLITIGRSPSNMIVLPEEDVSWDHGEIVFEQGEYVYRHLSTNPKSARTILRGRGREQLFRSSKGEEASLRNQDRLIIGKTTFIVEFDLINEDSGYTPTADSRGPR
jgi:FHA domain-containing protein